MWLVPLYRPCRNCAAVHVAIGLIATRSLCIFGGSAPGKSFDWVQRSIVIVKSQEYLVLLLALSCHLINQCNFLNRILFSYFKFANKLCSLKYPISFSCIYKFADQFDLLLDLRDDPSTSRDARRYKYTMINNITNVITFASINITDALKCAPYLLHRWIIDTISLMWTGSVLNGSLCHKRCACLYLYLSQTLPYCRLQSARQLVTLAAICYLLATCDQF